MRSDFKGKRYPRKVYFRLQRRHYVTFNAIYRPIYTLTPNRQQPISFFIHFCIIIPTHFTHLVFFSEGQYFVVFKMKIRHLLVTNISYTYPLFSDHKLHIRKSYRQIKFCSIPRLKDDFNNNFKESLMDLNIYLLYISLKRVKTSRNV